MAYSDIDSGKVLNKEGLLELCGQIKTEIANSASSGGATYTAGSGIDIDANGAISKVPSAIPLVGMLYLIGSNNTGVYNSTAWITTFLSGNPANWRIDNATAREKHIQNLKAFGMTYFPEGFVGDSDGQYLKQIITAVGEDDITTSLPIVNASGDVNAQYTVGMGLTNFSYSYMSMLGHQNKPVLIIFNGTESKGSNYRWWFIKNPEKVFQNKYFNSVSGLTSHSIPQAIDEVATNLNTRIPTAPAADGTYKLNCSVSSGSDTYGWVADTGGGGTTYTAGANITISNGEISATDTTYTAGTNISINNGVISATDTDTTYTAGTGINIDANNEISSTLTGLPAAPETAGTYILKCVKGVNSTAYSWEEVTVGGSY